MTPRQVVENYWKVECTRDVDATLACYGPRAELVVPGLGRLVGHEEIRRFYQASVERFPYLEVQIVGALENGDRAPSSGNRCSGTTTGRHSAPRGSM